jgi:hypothetical protein
LIKNNANPKKDSIELLNNLYEFAIKNVYQPKFKNGVEDSIRHLNQTLKKLKIIEIAFNDDLKEFKVKVINEIIE